MGQSLRLLTASAEATRKGGFCFFRARSARGSKIFSSPKRCATALSSVVRLPSSARGFEVVVYAPQGFLPFDLTSSCPAALLDPSPQPGPVERSHLWLRLLSPSRAMITRSSPSGRATFGMASTARTVMPPTRQKRSRPRRSSREGASPKGGAPFACPTSIRSKTPQKIFEPSARALDPATSRRLRDVSRSRSLAEFREFLPLGLTVLTRCA